MQIQSGRSTFEVEYHPATHCFRVEVTGSPGPEDWEKVVRWMAGQPENDGLTRSLWDLRGASLGHYREEDLWQQAARGGVFKDRLPRFVAIVVQGELDYGVARMWEVCSAGLGQERRVFRSMDEARAWLRENTPG